MVYPWYTRGIPLSPEVFLPTDHNPAASVFPLTSCLCLSVCLRVSCSDNDNPANFTPPPPPSVCLDRSTNPRGSFLPGDSLPKLHRWLNRLGDNEPLVSRITESLQTQSTRRVTALALFVCLFDRLCPSSSTGSASCTWSANTVMSRASAAKGWRWSRTSRTRIPCTEQDSSLRNASTSTSESTCFYATQIT